MGRHWWNGHLAADGSRRKDRGGRGRGRRLAGGGDLAHVVDTLRPAGETDGDALGQWRQNVRWERNERRRVRINASARILKHIRWSKI